MTNKRVKVGSHKIFWNIVWSMLGLALGHRVLAKRSPMGAAASLTGMILGACLWRSAPLAMVTEVARGARSGDC